MASDSRQADAYVGQVWLSRSRTWRDLGQFLDRAEAAFWVARSSENFPSDKFRFVAVPGGLEGALPFPHSFKAQPAY